MIFLKELFLDIVKNLDLSVEGILGDRIAIRNSNTFEKFQGLYKSSFVLGDRDLNMTGRPNKMIVKFPTTLARLCNL